MNSKTKIPSNIKMDDQIDDEIASYLEPGALKSFFLFAGAGSGKTRSLVNALNHVRTHHGARLALNGNRVAIVTYTNAACDEIQRRTEFDPLLHISTLHSFAWELIKGFQTDIRSWLTVYLEDKISQLNEKEKKNRQASKESNKLREEIHIKRKRLEEIKNISLFTYSPSGLNTNTDSLNHSEVIDITTHFLTHKPLMRWILVGRFPILLIDECQDTNKHLLDALFIVQKEHAARFSLGLIGDQMQRIYQDGKPKIDESLPDDWERPTKRLNHRCPKRVVKLINKIREEEDAQLQEARSDAPEGHVKLFIRRTRDRDHHKLETDIAHLMAVYTNDAKWNDLNNCKLLHLEHLMSARRLGFERVLSPFYKVQKWRTPVLDGSLPAIQFFTHLILPLVLAIKTGNKFEISRIIKDHCPLLTRDALKASSNPSALFRQAQSGVDELGALWAKSEPKCSDILLTVSQHRLLSIPEMLQPTLVYLNQVDQDEMENDTEEATNEATEALLSFLHTSLLEVKKYKEYIDGKSSFDTHQGIKGLEFPRVMVVFDDEEARGSLFKYGKIFGDKPITDTDRTNIASGKDNALSRVRRLLYVTCSRAEKSLALIVYTKNPITVFKSFTENNWFEPHEIDLEA